MPLDLHNYFINSLMLHLHTCLLLFYRTNFIAKRFPFASMQHGGRWNHCWLPCVRLLPRQHRFPVAYCQQPLPCASSPCSERQQVHCSQLGSSAKVRMDVWGAFWLYCESHWNRQSHYCSHPVEENYAYPCRYHQCHTRRDAKSDSPRPPRRGNQRKVRWGHHGVPGLQSCAAELQHQLVRIQWTDDKQLQKRRRLQPSEDPAWLLHLKRLQHHQGQVADIHVWVQRPV